VVHGLLGVYFCVADFSFTPEIIDILMTKFRELIMEGSVNF